MDESLVRLYGRSFKSYVIYVTFVTLGLIFPGMTRFVRGDNTGRYCHPEGGVLWGWAFLNKKSRGSLPGLKHFLPSLRPDDPVDADFYFFLERLDGGFGFRPENPIDCDSERPLNPLHPDAPAPPAQESSRVGGEEVFPGLRADDPVDGDAHSTLEGFYSGFRVRAEDTVDGQAAKRLLDLLDFFSPVAALHQIAGGLFRLSGFFRLSRRFLAEEFQDTLGVQPPHLLQPGGVFQPGGVVFVVDETVLRQHRGHGGMLEDIISGPLFASILQAATGGDGAMEHVLKFLRSSRHTAAINIALEARPAPGINMHGDEQVSTPGVRHPAALAQRRVCIPGAGHFNLNPRRF